MKYELVLISHALCPYVQRAAIAMTEKGMAFERRVVDLANKPDWFSAVSPLGKTPVLLVNGKAIFESSVILEYLEDVGPNPLHPADPLSRAEHRSWIEFGSAVLNDIAGFYSATAENFEIRKAALTAKFALLEQKLGAESFFAGERFSLVDAVFGPVFRYFDVFDKITDFGILGHLPKTSAWRKALAERGSIRAAVGPDYNERLMRFLRERNSHLSGLLQGPGRAALD